MNNLPDKPFMTQDFSPRGGGIDFLGLRYVNLHIVGNYLIPELNNVTRDMGMFFLGAWIPWKFRQIAIAKEFTEKNYREFREKVEVAISLNMRDACPATQTFGATRNRVGVTQHCSLPGDLSFKEAKRTRQNSFYAAAIYGPAFRALGLIKSYSVWAEDETSMNIATAESDPDTLQIIDAVDQSLSKASAYGKLTQLHSAGFTADDVDELGLEGLAPPRYRAADFAALKPCFHRKLLPTDPNNPGFARTQTTRLLLATLSKMGAANSEAVRDTWYTGLLPDGNTLQFDTDELQDIQACWSHFMARQYQRYAIELLLWCFETALLNGCRSIDEIVEYWQDRSSKAGHPLQNTFRDVLTTTAGDLAGEDDQETSLTWNQTVHADHPGFEYVEDPKSDAGCAHALRMLAGWYWRMLCRENNGPHKDLISFGGSDRMSMGWFLNWLRSRMDLPMNSFLKDVFSDLIFSQHMRVALSRFDGRAQRLRFVLGDSGIEPTSKRSDLGKLHLPWMPDRLDTLIELLCDIDVLRVDDENRIYPGDRTNEVETI